MGSGIDRGLDRSPRKRSDAERRNSPGFGTGMRLSSSLLPRLQPPVSPPNTPFILSVTHIGTILKYGNKALGPLLHRSTWRLLRSSLKQKFPVAALETQKRVLWPSNLKHKGLTFHTLNKFCKRILLSYNFKQRVRKMWSPSFTVPY